MSRHNYTNPAFCQNSEFYPSVGSVNREQDHHQQSFYNRSLNFSTSSNSASTSGAVKNAARDGPLRIQRSVSTRSFRTLSNKNTNITGVVERRFDAASPPRPGPKPGVHLNRTITTTTAATGPFESRSGSGRYALVPVEELPTARKDRYAIVPGPEPSEVVTPRRFVKSQDNLDRYSHLPVNNGPTSLHDEDSSEQYTSLPPISMYEEQPRMKPAFSSDFGSKTFVLVDQKSNQRYAMVPTAEDEEIVDDNHEIIQMHNGRAHRYAVIPAEDEEETCLSSSDLNQSHSNQDPAARTPLQTSTPQKGTLISSYPNTPLKNPAATRKLHELLSTPRKTPIKRTMSTPRHSNPNTPRYYQSQQIYPSQPERRKELSPHRLQYEYPQQQLQRERHAPVDSRTTAVIQPRVAMANPGDDSLNKTWNNSYPQKVANATATLAVVSLMLILGSAMNSGLCIYMIAHMGKSFYLQFSLAAAISGVGLGFLGFRSRHSEWLPNRSYTSGYVLVTMFCLLKCCGLLVLLALDPYPGFPLHDVTTGVILGLSAFTIFFIGLGVVGSYWCYRPPPDNRVNVVY